MALGVPVVVTPEVGLAPQVAERSAGLVADGAPAQFAEAIRRLADDEEFRRRCAEAALAAAREFSWDSVAASMENAYRTLADAR
jgi:glycosyltransferase involved in cell wall biosynthesis